jgi:predicted ATP-grasp superfamily ATP-dependent carboligase
MVADTPAVVVGAGINGLGVARSLALERVPVWLLDTDARRPEMRTSAANPVTVRSLQGGTLIEELVRLAETRFAGVRPVLFLTQEESVKAVSHHRDRLADLYRFSLPSVEIVDTLLHKQGFQRLAEQLDSPIPPLVHVRTPADLPALEKLRYPVVIKPGERNADYGHQFKKAYRVDNVAEGVELIRRILPVMADSVVQEWIEGPDSSIYFCLQYLDRQGKVAASFTGSKIRSWPPQVGGTASCVAAPEFHEELSAMTTQFLRAAGVVGMASMEYKRDVRSHEFRMVEPTVGRTDYQEEVATLNGTNLPYAAWCSELGRPLPTPAPTARPVVWRVQSEDMQSAAAQGQSLAHGYPGNGRVADALWRWNDPLPGLVQRLQRIRHALHNRTLKLLRGSPAAGSKS